MGRIGAHSGRQRRALWSLFFAGPKDIVIIGRAAGRLTGKAVGYIQNARGHIAPIMQRNEINTVHKELRETMAQLEAIRHEMRTGISIMNPGPLTSHVLENAVPGLSTAQQSPEQATANPPERAPLDHASQASPTQIVMQMQALRAASEQAARAASTVASSRGDPVGLASVIQQPKPSTWEVGKVPVQELVVLPISAVEAGLLPSNQEPISGGADIVFASIVERKVAFQSKKFFEEGET